MLKAAMAAASLPRPLEPRSAAIEATLESAAFVLREEEEKERLLSTREAPRLEAGVDLSRAEKLLG